MALRFYYHTSDGVGHLTASGSALESIDQHGKNIIYFPCNMKIDLAISEMMKRSQMLCCFPSLNTFSVAAMCYWLFSCLRRLHDRWSSHCSALPFHLQVPQLCYSDLLLLLLLLLLLTPSVMLLP